MPGWIQDAAGVNPVDWAVEAGRAAAMGDGTTGQAAVRVLLLAGFLLACAAFATRRFRAYQRSV